MIFKSNVYTYGGKTYLQSEGAPIGLDLSGEIGRLETADTSTKISNLYEENGIKLDYAGMYVDDLNNILGLIPFGYRWVNGEIQYNADWVEEDSLLPADKHTSNILIAISNSISEAIQFEGDVPSNHTSKKVPMLDMQMCIIQVEVPADPVTNTPGYNYPQVSYSFYKKPMARQTIMAATSAMPEGIKRETIVNEMLRRLSNISLNHPDTRDNVVTTINDYMVTMKRSG